MPAGVLIHGGTTNRPITYRTDVASVTTTYYGEALSIQQNPPALTVTSVSKASDASFAVTGHGLEVGWKIRIENASGDWAAINGDRPVKAVTDPNNFTIEDATTGFSGSFNGTVRVLAPRTSDAVWKISRQTYSAGNPTVKQNCDGDEQMDNVWDNRATLNYQ